MRTAFPTEAPQGAVARHHPLLDRSGFRRAGGPQASSNPNGLSFVSLAVKPVGKPDARNGPVRFAERGWKTGRRASVSTRVHPRLYPYGFSAARYSFCSSNCWFTSPVTYASSRAHLLSFMQTVHHRRSDRRRRFEYFDHTRSG